MRRVSGRGLGEGGGRTQPFSITQLNARTISSMGTGKGVSRLCVIVAGACAGRTGRVRTMRKDDIDIVHLQPLQRLLRALNNATNPPELRFTPRKPNTHCLRDRPPSFGPLRRPQKSFVVTMRSVRRMPSSLIARPMWLSDSPRAYASAVSIMLIPFSNATLMISCVRRAVSGCATCAARESVP